MDYDAYLVKVRKTKPIALMTHAVLGYPTFEVSQEIIRVIVGNGADILELQIPFSDPLADGEVIQQASDKALGAGMNFDRALLLINKVAAHANRPIVVMTYFNVLLHQGLKKALMQLRDVGVTGLIVPDSPLDLESNDRFSEVLKEVGLDNIRVISPNVNLERLLKNIVVSTGFTYCTSQTGITGGRIEALEELFAFLKLYRQHSELPVAVGFGIRTRDDVMGFATVADIAVVGSQIIRRYDRGGLVGLEGYMQELNSHDPLH